MKPEIESDVRLSVVMNVLWQNVTSIIVIIMLHGILN